MDNADPMWAGASRVLYAAERSELTRLDQFLRDDPRRVPYAGEVCAGCFGRASTVSSSAVTSSMSAMPSTLMRRPSPR